MHDKLISLRTVLQTLMVTNLTNRYYLISLRASITNIGYQLNIPLLLN